VRVFVTKVFARFARKERLDDERLCNAIARAEAGSIDAQLGGSLIKQRVARPGGGRSGGYRTVIAYRTTSRSVFLYGFAKNERENIQDRELDDFKNSQDCIWATATRKSGWRLQLKSLKR
jgi:hypothetical protein